ncbi:MAG: molecular chaperone [Alphaproteobacteria bacterium]
MSAGIFGLALVLVFATMGPVAAFKLTPIEITLKPTGRGASGSVVLQNPSEVPAAVELTVHERAMDLEGTDNLTPSPDRFLVIPSQVILMPGMEQAVRLQWLGGLVDEERAFRLVAEQLPIDLEDGQADGGRMRLLVRYVASLYVRPEGAEPKVRVTRGRVDAGTAGPELTFDVVNSGKARVALSSLMVQASRKGRTLLDLDSGRLGEVSGSVVLAGHTRRFRIPLESSGAPKTGPITVDLDYDGR